MTAAPLINVALDRAAETPLHRQLYEQVREMVLEGRLPPGARLPSTRTLAADLECSRNTVVTAFDQLLAEGYVEGQTGAGTFVSRVLPDELLSAARNPALAQDNEALETPPPSRRGRELAGYARPGGKIRQTFTPGLPDMTDFPFESWSRLVARFWRRPPSHLLRHGDPAGYLPLRAAIAQYLRAVRGLKVEAEQVFITAGAQQALHFAAQLLTDPGDRVWVEDPGYLGLRGPLRAAGLELAPLPVDREGLVVEAGRGQAPDARMAVVAPSHQYPLGVTLSLKRRLELLDWAREADAWIVEDDYDSEYRYAGRPLSALQGLEGAGGRVVYIGSFSKVMFPSLRLGYLVAPLTLVDFFRRARGALEDHPAVAIQPVLAAFIEDGHFAAHVRRMRRRYAARQEALLAAARRHLDGALSIEPDDGGLHLVAEIAPDLRLDDRQAAGRADEVEISTPPLSAYYLGKPRRQGLLVGYAAVPEEDFDPTIERLAKALAPARR
jgi:GntR family transcriptional regulator/MocR family aminotransferase